MGAGHRRRPGAAGTASGARGAIAGPRPPPPPPHPPPSPGPPDHASPPEIGVGLTGFGVLFTVLGVLFFFDKGLLAMGNVRRPAAPGMAGRARRGVGTVIPVLHPPPNPPPFLPPSPPPLQLLFLSGVALTIGPRATARFFTRRKNARVSAVWVGHWGGGGVVETWGWRGGGPGAAWHLARAAGAQSLARTLVPVPRPRLRAHPPNPAAPPQHPLQGSAFFGAGVVLVVCGWAVVGMLVEAYGFWLLFATFFPTVLAFLRRVPGLGPLLDTPALKRAINRVAPAQSLPI